MFLQLLIDILLVFQTGFYQKFKTFFSVLQTILSNYAISLMLLLNNKVFSTLHVLNYCFFVSMRCFDSLSIFTNSYNLNLKFIFFFFLCFVYRKTLEHQDSNSVCILLPFTLAGIFL